MLAACTLKARPDGDADYCRRVGEASSKRTQWLFHDDRREVLGSSIGCLFAIATASHLNAFHIRC